MNRLTAFLICGLAATTTFLRASDIVPDDAKLETLWDDGGFTEGAAVGPDGKMYFSDFAQPFDSAPARVMRFDPATGKTTVHCADSKMANGLMFDAQGRLIACCASPMGGRRALVEILPDGKVRTIVGKFEGKRFNSPNDIVIDRKGRIYFSDPKYVGPEKMELTSMNVYRLDPDGTIVQATTDIAKPNGVMLSPDGKTLYVNESVQRNVRAFTITKDRKLTDKRLIRQFEDHGFDGMRCDVDGNLYITRYGKGTVVKNAKGNPQAEGS